MSFSIVSSKYLIYRGDIYILELQNVIFQEHHFNGGEVLTSRNLFFINTLINNLIDDGLSDKECNKRSAILFFHSIHQ